MSRGTCPDVELEPALARRPSEPGRIAEFVDRHLAAARSEAQAGRMTQARQHLLSLRAGLVGRMPGECAGSPSDVAAFMR